MGVLASIRSSLRAVFAPGASSPGAGAWTTVVHEPATGAWQRNEDLRLDTALANPTVFRCVSLIASDIGKLPLRLVAVDQHGIWTETTSPAFSPVLRTPNRYQTPAQFFETWMFSKLLWGNTYVLKERDQRGVVVALYVLDPSRVKPLVAPDGAVYYELQVNELAGVPTGPLVAPARELIHDRWNCAFHPLVGLSPLYACGGAAANALAIQGASTSFFSNGGRPSGMLMPIHPQEIDKAAVARLSADWHALGAGRTAILTTAMKYEPVGSSAEESQLTAQIDQAAKTIAGCFGVPISMVDSSQQPPYANSEASALQYHSQCLQTHITAIEVALDTGLELPAPYGTEFDLDDLIWMDTATKTKAAHDAIAAGAMSPNEARRKYFGLGPVKGGDSPFMQQQYYSLEDLAARSMAPPPAPAPVAPPVEADVEADVEAEP